MALKSQSLELAKRKKQQIVEEGKQLWSARSASPSHARVLYESQKPKLLKNKSLPELWKKTQWKSRRQSSSHKDPTIFQERDNRRIQDTPRTKIKEPFHNQNRLATYWDTTDDKGEKLSCSFTCNTITQTNRTHA